jgi:hypothetical protein
LIGGDLSGNLGLRIRTKVERDLGVLRAGPARLDQNAALIQAALRDGAFGLVRHNRNVRIRRKAAYDIAKPFGAVRGSGGQALPSTDRFGTTTAGLATLAQDGAIGVTIKGCRLISKWRGSMIEHRS